MTKILAIDDKNDNLISLKAILKDIFADAEVFTALSGIEGLELAAAEDPDIILLDILMPVMDGFEVCRRLKEDPILRDIPVVFITALKETKNTRLRALEMGAEAFLAKPIDETELTVQVRAMLKIRAANKLKRNEKKRLAELIAERTWELEQSQIITLKLVEELKAENEARKKVEQELKQKEAIVRNKLKIITEPEGDIGTLELSDIIDTQVLQSMMDDFYQLTGMLGAIIDIKGKVLVAVGWQDICTKFHRRHPETLKNCIDCDMNLTKGVQAGTFKSYRCKNNMVDTATPLIVAGKHVGNIFMGQYFTENEKPDVEVFRKQANTYGFDEKEYLAALDRVPHYNEEKVNAGMKFYSKLAGLISTLSFSAITQSRLLAERKVAEVELIIAKEEAEESEKYLYSIIDTMSDPVFVKDDQSKLVLVNNAFCTLFGLSRERLVGRTLVDDVTSEVYGNFLDIDNKVLSGGEEDVNEESISIRGAQKRTLLTKKTRFIDNSGHKFLVGAIHDITDRKYNEIELLKAKDKAEENEQSYKGLVQSSHNLIWKCDVDGKFTFLNSAWENTHGYKIEDMLGKPFSDFQRPEVFQRDVVEFSKHLKGGFVEGYETTHITKNGDEIYLIFNALPLFDSSGEIVGTQGTAFDISKLKKTKLELIKSKEKAEESDRLKSAFLANMSHEIRTPMNGILGFAGLLKTPNLTGDQQQEYIQIIEKSGDRMLNIINDIISISKIESGLIELNITKSNINEQIEYIHTFFKPEVEEKGIQFIFKNALPVTASLVETDKEKLFAILTNLVKNAIKHTERGAIELGYTNKDGYLEFYVKDTGIGIDDDRQQAIFERFIQADISDKKALQGAGLGLSISKAYVEMLGGTLWVDSKKGVGSTFFFTIPFTTEEQEIEEIPETIINDKHDLKEQRLKILIVEDDETSDLLLSMMLEGISRETLHAKTGLEAIEICRKTTDLDLILMDIKMPGISGYEATREIRLFNSEVKIIAQTAFGLSGDREKSIEAGCDDYITKPILIEKLLALIQKTIKIK